MIGIQMGTDAQYEAEERGKRYDEIRRLKSVRRVMKQTLLDIAASPSKSPKHLKSLARSCLSFLDTQEIERKKKGRK